MTEQDNEDVPWKQYGDVEREDPESKGLIGRSREDKIGWIGFGIVAVPLLVLGFMPPAGNAAGVAGFAIGAGAVGYIFFYAAAKILG